jgi:hypothetical protein
MPGFNQTYYSVGLGRNRAAIASIKRPYTHLAVTQNDPNPIHTLFNFKTNVSLTNIINNTNNTNNNTRQNTIPEPPTNLSFVANTTQLTIAFTAGSDGGTPIIDYLYSIDNGLTYTFFRGIRSPIIITGLTPNTNYNIKLKAVNIVGQSNESVNINATTLEEPDVNNNGPLAPVITGINFKTIDSITLTFTQEPNEITVTNYKYSLNNAPFVALSPVDITSPITISGLTSNTTYNIRICATSAVGDGAISNTYTEPTYANVNYVTFTAPGASVWQAPEDVTFVQYLVVGGGGGGGAAYSKINVLGDVLVTNIPQSYYWINSGDINSNFRYNGRMYLGTTTTYQNSVSFPDDPIQLTASQNYTPSGVVYPYNKWYNTEMVYTLRGSLVGTTNYFPPYIINSTYCNNISGGGGGGAGGQVKVLSGTNKYNVIPGNTYQITVGAGGQGGIGGNNSETNGNPGGDSSFDTIISVGGSGGGFSRNGFNTDAGKNGKGGNGGQTIGTLVGGSGGGQTNTNNYGRYNSGGPGASGSYINFDGNPLFYGAGGNGGVPNTVATGTTIESVGKGGNGTGATLNSYANGIDGGSGIVILKYYTSVISNPTTLTYSTFTNVGITSWTAPQNVRSVEYLLVGGGGGSGATHDGGSAGGGGGGMVLTGSLSVNPNEVYTIIVGDGGDGGIGLPSPQIRETDGNNGENSQFASIIALGGGGGYRSRFNGTGVGGTIVTLSNIASTGGYGGTFNNGGGGGGGNLSNGSSGTTGLPRTGGSGGSGLSSDISGTSKVYGAGGAGGNGQTNENAIAGQINTGNGAKGPGTTFGNQKNGAKGGSGIVILKYYT